MHRQMYDLLCIHKTYSTANNPKSIGAVEKCNHTLPSMLGTVYLNNKTTGKIISELPFVSIGQHQTPVLESAHTRWSMGLR